MSRSVLMILSVVVLSPAEAGQEAGEIPRLIRQLGAEKREDREAASKRLEEIGAQTLDALREAAKADADAEVRQRAGRLVKIITMNMTAAIATRVFTGHDGQVTYAVFSPDGQQVLSASD